MLALLPAYLSRSIDLCLYHGFSEFHALPRGIAIFSFGKVPANTVALSGSAITSPVQQPDNTGANKDQSHPTADNQKETPADRELASKIRQSIVSDKSLSTDAHNVKIIVPNGVVALRGPVKSEDETGAVAERRPISLATAKFTISSPSSPEGTKGLSILPLSPSPKYSRNQSLKSLAVQY